MTDGNRCVLIAPPARNSRQPGSRAPMSRASTAQPHAPKCSVQDCFVCVSCSHAKNSAKPNYKSIRKVWVKLIGRKSSGGARNPCLAMKRDSAAPHLLTILLWNGATAIEPVEAGLFQASEICRLPRWFAPPQRLVLSSPQALDTSGRVQT